MISRQPLEKALAGDLDKNGSSEDPKAPEAPQGYSTY